MEWFKVPLLPSKNLKKEMEKVVILLKAGPNDVRLKSVYSSEVLNKISENEITKKISEMENYNECVEALRKLETLHYTKKQFEELTEYCRVRSVALRDEIYKIEQEYIEPTYVYYGPVSYPKRTYKVDGEDYTTYKGPCQYNGSFFAAVLTLVISGIFFG